MKQEILSREEKLEIIKKLEIYGISNIPFLLFKSGNEKIRAFSGNLNKDEINKLAENIFIETIGLYFAKIDGQDVRLSVDACHLLKQQIKNNVIELTQEQAEEYLKGRDIQIEEEQEKFSEKKIYYILKHKEDILGMSKIVNKQIKNYLPKERRRKN